MRNRWFPAGALAVASMVTVAASGCSAPGEGLETGESPVVAGTADTHDPSIVEVFSIGKTSVSKCTATLISPRVLLSAAHCVFERPGTRFGVFLGNDDRKITGKDLLPVSNAIYDPLYNNDPSVGHDISVFVLATPLTMLTPVPVNRASLANAVGKTARVVGYGLNNGVTQSGDGIKREAEAPLAQITRPLIRVAPNAHGSCNGDSGGPLLMDNGAGEAVIGVVSFGDDATCRRNSYYQRVDTQLGWVDEMVRKYDPGAAIPDGGAPPVTADAGTDAQAPSGTNKPDAKGESTTGDDAGGDLPPIVRPPAKKPDAGEGTTTPPPVKRDAAAPKPPVMADAGTDDEGDGVYTQSVAGSACALGGPSAAGLGASLPAVVLLLGAALLRRRRGRWRSG